MSSLYLVMFSLSLCCGCLIFALKLSLGGPRSEDRRFLDPVPRPWSLFWTPICVLSPAFEWLLNRCGVLRQRLDHGLQAAGLSRSLNSSQLLAGTCVLSLVCAVLLTFAQYVSGSLMAVSAQRSCLIAPLFGVLFTHSWLRRQIRDRRQTLARQLPVVADFIAMCVEAGLPIGAALNQVVERCPSGVLRSEFSYVLRDMKAGRRRPEALQAMADRLDHAAVSQFVLVLNAADRDGVGVAHALKAQAEQYRTERFHQAESLAMQAPVKMLAPMILFIFPGTFVILLFPVLSRLLAEGVFK